MTGSKKYNNEYKVEAVRLVKEIGNKRAAEELEVPKATLSGWIAKARKGELDIGLGAREAGEAMSIAAEMAMIKKQNKELMKENKRLQEENEFLAEASAFFASSRRKSGRLKD